MAAVHTVRDEHLRGRRVKLLRDLDDLGVVRELRLAHKVIAERAVCGNVDVVLLRELVEVILLQQRVRLNLVHSLHDDELER